MKNPVEYSGEFENGIHTLAKENQIRSKEEKDEFEIDYTLSTLNQKLNDPGLKGMILYTCELDKDLRIRLVAEDDDDEFDSPGLLKMNDHDPSKKYLS